MANQEGDTSSRTKLHRPTWVKNKTLAPIQITADQILREARDRQEPEIRPPKHKITDPTELPDYLLRNRKHFEDQIRRARWKKRVWVKYAKWEESQKDFNGARSVWERALDVDYRDHTMWLKYAEVEMKNKFINHARNVWDRAVTFLPRVDQLWYKYIHMEEMLGNVAGARLIFERWMSWEPDQQAWLSYIKFELRYNEIERARSIYEKFVRCIPKVGSWIRYAKFEMKNGEIRRARNCYERAVDKLADDEDAETLFIAFAEFEEKCKETERARCIYKFALDHVPKGRAKDLYRKFVALEKRKLNAFDYTFLCCLHFSKPEIPVEIREKLFHLGRKARKQHIQDTSAPPFCGTSRAAIKRRARRYERCHKCGNWSHSGNCSKNQTYAQYECTQLIQMGPVRMKAEHSIRARSYVKCAIQRDLARIKDSTGLEEEDLKIMLKIEKVKL